MFTSYGTIAEVWLFGGAFNECMGRTWGPGAVVWKHCTRYQISKARANVAWDNVRVASLCLKFTTVKLQGLNKPFKHFNHLKKSPKWITKTQWVTSIYYQKLFIKNRLI